MSDTADALAPLPLYKRAKEMLVKRIADGRWVAGQLIPSEFEIARELGVSQGTVRKALDEMTSQNLLVRRQGVGTFVARHDDARILFQFFRLTPDDGERAFPESEVVSSGRRAANEEERARLALAPNSDVVEIRRVRSLEGLPAIAEVIVVPARLFPDIERQSVPNNLYALYAERFGVTIGEASERLKAVAADTATATALGMAPGAPLLAVDRIAFALDGSPAELRLSLCRTDRFHYSSELR
jgi:GntR family transcriptional regulator